MLNAKCILVAQHRSSISILSLSPLSIARTITLVSIDTYGYLSKKVFGRMGCLFRMGANTKPNVAKSFNSYVSLRLLPDVALKMKHCSFLPNQKQIWNSIGHRSGNSSTNKITTDFDLKLDIFHKIFFNLTSTNKFLSFRLR